MTQDGTRTGGAAGAEAVRVLRGNPTPEELAAAIAVVRRYAAASAAEPAGVASTTEWSSPVRGAARRMPQPGPHAWRTTYWPG